MKISIVTPSFNQGRFIKRNLDSVRAQTGDFSVEHIILDNCSTDGTRAILGEYAESHGSVDIRIHIERDKGQTAAINRGFALASGDLVCWLNTDEWYTEGALASVASFFDAHPAVDVVFGDCDFVSVDGSLVKRKREHFFSCAMLLYYGCFVPSCATFVRRRALNRVGPLDTDFKVTMDFEWYMRLAQAGCAFAHLPLVLAKFTWHESNISSNLVERRLLERREVQDRFSGIKGPAWLRRMIYRLLRDYWISVRIVRRAIA